MKIENVQANVNQILLMDERSRNDDSYLYLRVCQAIYSNIGSLSFAAVMRNKSVLGLPTFEAVRRARQKLQAKDESLRASESTKKARTEKEKEYRDYALS